MMLKIARVVAPLALCGAIITGCTSPASSSIDPPVSSQPPVESESASPPSTVTLKQLQESPTLSLPIGHVLHIDTRGGDVDVNASYSSSSAVIDLAPARGKPVTAVRVTALTEGSSFLVLPHTRPDAPATVLTLRAHTPDTDPDTSLAG